MKIQIQFRDLLAVPFMFIALLFEYIAITIGGKWTAVLILATISETSNERHTSNITVTVD